MRLAGSVHYLRLKSDGRTETFKTATTRNVSYLIVCLEDLDLSRLQLKHGGIFRDYLMNRGLTSASVSRIFSTVKAVMNLSISEQGIEIKNPIVRVFIPNDGKTLKRLSLPDLVIKKLQEEARLLDV